MASKRSCKHPVDAFCFICREFIKTRGKKFSISSLVKMCEAYKAYFEMHVGDQDKSLAPHITCATYKNTERVVSLNFVQVVKGFLGNHKAENYIELVETLVKYYSKMGCRMSLKVHILDAHLHSFKENMGAYSEK